MSMLSLFSYLFLYDSNLIFYFTVTVVLIVVMNRVIGVCLFENILFTCLINSDKSIAQPRIRWLNILFSVLIILFDVH
jgi:hypothetical protein